MNRLAQRFAIVFIVLIAGCKYKDTTILGHSEKPFLSFKSIEGIPYTEIRRQQNGLSFNEYGYHLNADWKLRFVSKDSIALYSPVKKQFLNFPLSCGIDSVFNTNRSFLRMKHMSKDSLIFELIQAKNDSLEIKGTQVYMLFYADNYIKNVLHSDATTLQASTRQDSLFIKKLIKKADSSHVNAFAALNPVRMISNKPFIVVQKRKTVADFLINNYNTSDDYMSPTYDIVIKKANADFHYSFSAYVDAKGRMYFNKPLLPLPDGVYKDKYIRSSKALINNYLKIYLKVVPGKTLNMAHTSEINLYVQGKKA
jgi:hypothetical protein